MKDMKNVKKFRSRNKEKLKEIETRKHLKKAVSPKIQVRYSYQVDDFNK